MADSGQVKAYIGGLESGIKKALTNIFEYVLANLSFGMPEHQKRCTNFQLYRLTGTTSGTANQEFSIAHGLGRQPVVAWQVYDLALVNSEAPALTVSRAADMNRLYFSSPSTGATFVIFVG